MKGLYSIQEDSIVSYGVIYDSMSEEESVYTIPDDFEFGKYNYISQTPGIFDPNGFTLIQNTDEENPG